MTAVYLGAMAAGAAVALTAGALLVAIGLMCLLGWRLCRR